MQPHPESPMQIPLVRQMLSDQSVRLAPRRIDVGWRDNRRIRLSVGGFNPFLGAVFYAQRSPLADWLKDPTASLRAFNRDDLLIRDLFFAVHDYLHVWGTRLIQTLAPQVGFGTAPIHEGNLEDMAFCQLVSETIATVGLDYWYLCTVELNELLPIGTRLSKGLTTAYHERHLPEFQRFYPELAVQRPGFFGDLCRFYCTGELMGFDASDIRHSPLLLGWLAHELTYGEKQREYSRSWFSYLSTSGAEVPEERLGAPIDAEVPWRAALIEEVGAALWRLVKEGTATALSQDSGEPWRAPAGRRLDFRFCNVNAVDDELLFSPKAARAWQEHFDHYLAQVVSRYDHAAFDPELCKLLPVLGERRDVALLRSVLKGERQLPVLAGEAEPRDLFFLN